MISYSKYFQPSLVSLAPLTDRDQVIENLVDLAVKAEKIPNKGVFFDAVMGREKIVTTGIGMGVAIPHAKLHDCDDFFIAVAILPKGVHWNSLDGAPVRLVFLIGGPDDKQTEYLKLLSSLTQAIKGETMRRQLLSAQSGEEVCLLLSNATTK